MQVEIIGTDGKVHYRRPHDHKDVAEALVCLGYSVFCPGVAMEVLNKLPVMDGRAYPMVIDSTGLRIYAPGSEPCEMVK